jgi:hypothetical protein
VNHRLRALLLTSWPVIDTMYNDKWPIDPSRGVAWKDVKDGFDRWDVSEFNNVPPYGKTWPNPNEKFLDGTACVFCQNSLCFLPKQLWARGLLLASNLRLPLPSTMLNPWDGHNKEVSSLPCKIPSMSVPNVWYVRLHAYPHLL